jgi:hypothetical protein
MVFVVLWFATLVVVLIIWLGYASNIVLASDDAVYKTLAYITAILDAWFLGALYGAIKLLINQPDCQDVKDEIKAGLDMCEKKVASISAATRRCGRNVRKVVDSNVYDVLTCIDAIRKKL